MTSIIDLFATASLGLAVLLSGCRDQVSGPLGDAVETSAPAPGVTSAPKFSLPDGLDGRWQNVAIPADSMTIVGDVMRSYVSGTLVGESSLRRVAGCSGLSGLILMEVEDEMGGGGKSCLSVLEMSKDRLVLVDSLTMQNATFASVP